MPGPAPLHAIARNSRGAAAGQRGSIALLGAIWLSVAVICLAGIDVGNVFWQKREVQKIADLSALAGAVAVSSGCASAQQRGRDNAVSNGLTANDTFSLGCGSWDRNRAAVNPATGIFPARYYAAGATPTNATQVTISRPVPYFILFSAATPNRMVTAVATARGAVSASLSIRSKMGEVDASQSPVLNALVGGMLGGTLNVSVGGWNGLLLSDVRLLDFLDQLALRLNVTAGDYTALLATRATVGQLLDAVASALSTGADARTAAVGIAGAAQPLVRNLQMPVGDLLRLQTGTPVAGLDTKLQAFQLVQTIVQLANYKNAAVVAVPFLNVFGIGTVQAYVQAIEPPQFVIGNPVAAATDSPPYAGANQIFVRTAQVRSLVSVDLSSALSSLSATLLSAVGNLVAPITPLLNSVLSLNLVDLVSNILCVGCTRNVTDIQVVAAPFRFDVNVDAGAASARVSGFTCRADGSRSLDVQATSAAASIRVGRMGTSAADARTKVFASAASPAVSPIPLIDIGVQRYACVSVLGVGVCTKDGARQAFAGGGLGLKTDTTVAATTQGHTFTAAAGAPFQTWTFDFPGTLVASLGTSLAGIDIQAYKPTGAAASPLGDLLSAAGGIIANVVAALSQAVKGVLSALLDPVIKNLFGLLGLDLARTDVSATLGCGEAELVY